MDGSEDIVLKLTRTQVNADFATVHLKTQSIFGPLVGKLMGSDMLFAKFVKRTTVLYPFQSPSSGLWNSYGIRFFRDPKTVKLIAGPRTQQRPL